MNKYIDKKFFLLDKTNWKITAWKTKNWIKYLAFLLKINWIKVKMLWTGAFANKKLTNIKIPNSVKVI